MANILVKFASGTDNGFGSAGTYEQKLDITSALVRQTDGGVDILQGLETVPGQHLISHFSDTTTTQWSCEQKILLFLQVLFYNDKHYVLCNYYVS